MIMTLGSCMWVVITFQKVIGSISGTTCGLSQTRTIHVHLHKNIKKMYIRVGWYCSLKELIIVGLLIYFSILSFLNVHIAQQQTSCVLSMHTQLSAMLCTCAIFLCCVGNLLLYTWQEGLVWTSYAKFFSTLLQEDIGLLIHDSTNVCY